MELTVQPPEWCSHPHSDSRPDPCQPASRRNLSCELKLHILRRDRVVMAQISPVLYPAIVRPTKPSGGCPRESSVSPRKGSQCGEVARQSLLHLGLQRAVLGVAPSVATHVDAVATSVAAVAESWVLLKCRPEGNCPLKLGLRLTGPCRPPSGRPGLGRRTAEPRTWRRPQVELVQIDAAKAEKSPAAT